MSALAHHSSNGKTYYLHSSSRLNTTIFYFSLKADVGAQHGMAVPELPPGKVVVECSSGFPILRNAS